MKFMTASRAGRSRGVAAAAPMRAARSSSSVLVKVNGDIITQTDLESGRLPRSAPGWRGELQPDGANNARAEEGDRRSHAAAARRRRSTSSCSFSMGKEQGYHLSDEQFKSIVDNIRKEHKLERRREVPGGAEAGRHDAWTTAQERREADARRRRSSASEVGRSCTITEEEARQYYDATRSEFTKPATVTLREILIEVPRRARRQST